MKSFCLFLHCALLLLLLFFSCHKEQSIGGNPPVSTASPLKLKSNKSRDMYSGTVYWDDSASIRYDSANDATGLISMNQINASSTFTYNYQRDSQQATELQKFIARLADDLVWFQRAKTFDFFFYIGYDYYLAGNILQSITRDNQPYYKYSNELDDKGILKKIVLDLFSNEQYIQEFEYWP